MGFSALDFILKMNGGSWTASSSDFVAADITIDGKPLTLFKPLTYMNVCGQSVADFVDSRGIQSSDILVCFDDVALHLVLLDCVKEEAMVVLMDWHRY